MHMHMCKETRTSTSRMTPITMCGHTIIETNQVVVLPGRHGLFFLSFNLCTRRMFTLTLGVSGAIYNSFMKALKDKLGVTQPRLNTLINKLHHMAVVSLNRIWDQRWAMINRLQLDGSTAAPRSTAGHHQSTSRRTTRNKFSSLRRHGNNQPQQLPPKQGQG
jgi:hypothetical protein